MAWRKDELSGRKKKIIILTKSECGCVKTYRIVPMCFALRQALTRKSNPTLLNINTHLVFSPSIQHKHLWLITINKRCSPFGSRVLNETSQRRGWLLSLVFLFPSPSVSDQWVRLRPLKTGNRQNGERGKPASASPPHTPSHTPQCLCVALRQSHGGLALPPLPAVPTSLLFTSINEP